MMNNMIDELTHQFVLPLWNEQNLNVIDRYVAPNADIRTTFLSGCGPSAMKQSIEDTFKAFPIFKLSLEEIIQQNNQVTFKWFADVKHEGTILNIKPTGNEMQFHGIVFGEINEGLITQYHSFSNIPQVLYSNIQPLVSERFPTHVVLLDHENYEKEISELLFLITKFTGVRLTRREAECLNFWFRGYSIKETAKQLGGLSSRTIQVFRDKIRAKFNVRNFQALIKLAEETGILSFFLKN